MNDKQGCKYKSDVFAAIHETMDALHQTDAINKQTMREFDRACLTFSSSMWIKALYLHAKTDRASL